MQLVIPTYGRPRRQTTLAALPKDLRREVLLVTSDPAEAEFLAHAWRADKVRVKNAPVATIADKRQWILENVPGDVFMLDDDMVFYRRCPVEHRVYEGRWRANPGHKTLSLDYVSDRGLVDLFQDLELNLARHGLVGISSRFGNDCEPVEHRSGANRLMHGFGYRKKLIPKKFRFSDVMFREDFHLALTMYKQGHASYQRYDWCVAPGAYGAPGGCSSERTVPLSNKAAEKLAELHAPFVAVVDKPYKGVPRKEVRVQWKKALETARAK